VGKLAIGFYLGRSSVSSAYGAAGSLVVLLLWVYYSAMVFFFGAEITEVYARENRSSILPDETSERVPQSREDPEGERASGGGIAEIEITESPLPRPDAHRESTELNARLGVFVGRARIAGRRWYGSSRRC
jgi:hypothetical protein